MGTNIACVTYRSLELHISILPLSGNDKQHSTQIQLRVHHQLFWVPGCQGMNCVIIAEPTVVAQWVQLVNAGQSESARADAGVCTVCRIFILHSLNNTASNL